MVNAVLADLLSQEFPRRRWLTSAALTLLLLVGSIGYGLSVLAQPSNEPTIAVTVIQGNIGLASRWAPELRSTNLAKHVSLTREATANGHRTSLVVWPETAVQGFLAHDLRDLEALSTLARTTQAHLLVGSAARPKFGPREFRDANRFNSALLISPRGPLAGQYNKIRLVPFSEYLPYKDLPWPSRYRHSGANLLPGNDYTIFSVDGARFGVTICWENIFPELFRQFVRNGAQFMVNITNEAWFGETAAPNQMLAMSVFRAVENRVAIARSANTGISGFIDPYGRLMGKVVSDEKDIFVEGHLTKLIPLSEQKTFYTIYGDVFAQATLLLTAGMLMMACLQPRLRRPTGSRAADGP